jgi:hypothetical protein
MIMHGRKEKSLRLCFCNYFGEFFIPWEKESLYSFRRIFKIVFLLNNIYIYFRIKCYKNARADTAALYLANN